MKTVTITSAFKKDIKRIKKRNKDLQKLYWVVEQIALDQQLEKKYYVHQLVGNYRNKWECHIEPDWLLIYEINVDIVILYRTGTHSDLFT
jgi:mRNA interferase YafQ